MSDKLRNALNTIKRHKVFREMSPNSTIPPEENEVECLEDAILELNEALEDLKNERNNQ